MEPSELTAVMRVLDAEANRAAEAARVVEDYLRFALDDRHLTGRCKQLRHDLAAALSAIPAPRRLAARDTQRDVGTTLTLDTEQQRSNASQVAAANLKRLEQSLRSLEEYSKTVSPAAAAPFEQLRYAAYTLERATAITSLSCQKFPHAALYVLTDGGPSGEVLAQRAAALVQAGVRLIQLRDKKLKQRQLLERARTLRPITRDSGALLIVNDRPDLAVLADADGVHLGQDDLSVKDARSIVGPDRLIGVSTHCIEQARQAVLDGAGYIGVGPTFVSPTKAFTDFPGVELLNQVAAEIRLPAFAIGGISDSNVHEVLAAGFRRIAVGSAVVDASDPAAAARRLLAAIESGAAV
jgi:thiamine-phosphate pyrophosphorylase